MSITPSTFAAPENSSPGKLSNCSGEALLFSGSIPFSDCRSSGVGISGEPMEVKEGGMGDDETSGLEVSMPMG